MNRPSPRDRLAGLAALVVLLAVVAGVPVLLLALGASPVPGAVSVDGVLDALTSPDDGTALIVALRVIAWLAWAFVTVSVVVEVPAQLRGVRAPRLPGLSLPQGMARGLVAAVIVLIASPVAAQAAAAPASAGVPVPVSAAVSAPASAPAPASASASKGVPSGSGAAAESSSETGDAQGDLVHTVESGDSLWALAERYLGNGAQYQFIASANYGRTQPDGASLGDDHWLRPGWKLTIPGATAQQTPGKHTYTVDSGDTLWQIAEDQLGDGKDYPRLRQADGTRISDPDLIRPGEVLRLPGEKGHTAERPVSSSTPEDDGRTDQAPGAESADASAERSKPVPDEAPVGTVTAPSTRTAAQAPGETPVRTASTVGDRAVGAEPADDVAVQPAVVMAGAGTALAVGLLGLLAVRRRRQQRRRRPGQRMLLPEGDLVAAERELRAQADPVTVTTVDRALRSLAVHQARTGGRMPALLAVRLTGTQLELFLDGAPETALPAPWEPAGDEIMWVLPAETASTVEEVDVPAPYPGLVTVGFDEAGGQLLVDLGHIGVLSVAGPVERSREIATALAVELATSAWADDLQVSVIGPPAGLENDLRTGRLTHRPQIGHVLDDLEERAGADRQAFLDAGVADVQEARTRGLVPDAWAPDVVVMTSPPGPEQRAQLSRVVLGERRAAVAAVVCGEAPGDWVLRLDDDGSGGTVEPIGIRVRPQHVPAAAQQAVVDLLELTEADTPSVAPVLELVPDLAPDHPDPATVASAVDGSRAPVVRVLGTVDVLGAGGDVEPDARAHLTELAAYLALTRGASAEETDAAIWPRNPAAGNLRVRNTATSRLRSWLGRDRDGNDWLPRHQGDVHRLDGRVRADWDVWRELLPDGPLRGSSQALELALGLVRGRPFLDVHPRRYVWADPFAQRMIAEIVDAAWELGRRRLAEGRLPEAENAVSAGLAILPELERLWRLRILVAREAGDAGRVEEVVARMLVETDEHGGELEPQTRAMLENLGAGRRVGLAEAL
ncbi:LysM peptidoglycan-binding domain-containing protein [Kineosporia sp. J2-2]|uniref:LysM peptidoglycan-binding domain-containing protein n=1 Tax=Kineosporia corallincola TaxID=2835133 RepID=A0ABS5TQM1_9ACTN|nr:LysM peptidoglycan-binding domain-containing protein [Kineosporia corallincola]MBT0773243.1 LysM peptidoglycan-binding domain-containing protein [Kineosporia corallincola]